MKYGKVGADMMKQIGFLLGHQPVFHAPTVFAPAFRTVLYEEISPGYA